jgi:hypothetical protein
MSPYSPKATNILTDYLGIEHLIDFYHNAFIGSCQPKFDISLLSEMDANLSAVFLAIAHKLNTSHNKRCFIELGGNHSIFFRNGLIAHLQGKGNDNPYTDDRKSTVPCRTYMPSDDDSFASYISKDFLRHRSVENIPYIKKQEIKDHYCEIFANVDLHAKTSLPIFTCGQYYPVKQQLKFTLVDLGIGFLEPIKNTTNHSVSSYNDAINWALMNRNTTLPNGLGGFGLKDLRNYCDTNNGILQICSGNGFVTFVNRKTVDKTLKNHFPGTIINIIFRNI